MKNKNILSAGLLLLFYFLIGNIYLAAQNTTEKKVLVLTTSDLSSLSKTLIDKYSQVNLDMFIRKQR